MFDQAKCKHGSTVFENNTRDSIRTIRFLMVKASEGWSMLYDLIGSRNTSHRPKQSIERFLVPEARKIECGMTFSVHFFL